MLRVDCYDFYKLGVQIHPLTVLKDDATLSDSWIALWLARGELDTFFHTFPLKTSRNPASDLYLAINELLPEDVAQLKTSDDEGNPRLVGYLGGLLDVPPTNLKPL